MFGRISKNNITQQQPQPQQPQQMNVFMGFRKQGKPTSLTQIQKTHQLQKQQQLPQYAPSDGHKMRWGKPTWHFFHTLAYKIKAEAFPLVRAQTLQIIMQICASLPCPMCSDHATNYLKKINLNAVQTKNDFIDLFYAFHNSVNERKRYRLFLKEDMQSVYENASIVDAYNDFMRYYADKQRGFRLMADNMVRTQNLQIIKTWFQSVLPHCA